MKRVHIQLPKLCDCNANVYFMILRIEYQKRKTGLMIFQSFDVTTSEGKEWLEL
jgi:hypothetical protein